KDVENFADQIQMPLLAKVERFSNANVLRQQRVRAQSCAGRKQRQWTQGISKWIGLTAKGRVICRDQRVQFRYRPNITADRATVCTRQIRRATTESTNGSA